MNQPDVLEAKGVGLTVAGREVLSAVDLSVRGGEVCGLIGPNGGGKSSLLLVLAGLVRATVGEATVCGRPAHEVAVTATGSVGLVTAEPGLYPALTGRENLRWFGGLYRLSSAQVDERAAPLLRRLGLDAALDRPVAGWSSGMRQKLSLVRALLLSPPALLLDEPTANLDPVSAWQILEAVRAQADAGVAVVLCTHDLSAAERWCDRVAYLDRRLGPVLEMVRPVGGREVGPLLRLFPSA